MKALAVHRIFLAGLAAFQTLRVRVTTTLDEAWNNKRLRAGALVGMVALPSWFCHLFFDIDQRIEGFYYVNYVFYFHTIRAYIAGFFLLSGAFITLPQKWSFKWIAVPIAGFCLVKIYEESFYTSYKDFYKGMVDWQMVALMLLCLPAFFKIIDYMLYRKYHLKDGNVARMIGIIKAPGISLERKMNILEELVEESENFNARI